MTATTRTAGSTYNGLRRVRPDIHPEPERAGILAIHFDEIKFRSALKLISSLAHLSRWLYGTDLKTIRLRRLRGEPCAVLGHVSNFGSCSQPSLADTSLALIGLQGGMKRSAIAKQQTDKELMSYRVVHKSA